ncbi:MAG: hypothetical protein R2764_04715 [Bacteroidales bacterium]
MTDEDIEVLLGNTPGTVELVSMNLIPGNTVGTYWIVPGSYLTNNFNVTYEPYYYSIVPATATISFSRIVLRRPMMGCQNR